MNRLLRCLLCLLLVVNAAGSAWAATAMSGAMQGLPASSTAHHGSDDAASPQPAVAGCHGEGAQAGERPLSCSTCCDCLQVASALPDASALPLPCAPALAPCRLPAGGRLAPLLPQPVRPPIGIAA